MKRMVAPVLFATLAALVAGRVFAAEKWTKPQQEIADLFKAWAESEMAADVEREMKLMAPTLMAWDFSQPAPMDRAAFRQTTVDLFKKSKVTACEIPPSVIHIEGKTAVAHGRYAETMQDASGAKTAVQGPWIASLIHDGSKWLVLSVAWAADHPAPDGAAIAATEQQLIQFEHDWAKAYVNRDAAALARLMADDFVSTDSDGNVVTKVQELEAVKTGGTTATSITHENTKARVFGDTAVVSGRSTLKMHYLGQEVTGQVQWTDTWVKRDGRWQCVAGHFSKVALAPVDAAMAEKELSQLENDWAKAYVDRDTATLGRLEADDWVYTDQDGNVISRAQDIADVQSGTYLATDMKQEDIKVRLYGDTAVVTARSIAKATYKGQDASGTYRFTDTWIRGPGGWKCVVTHLSKVPAK